MPKITYDRLVIDLNDATIKALPGTPKLLLPASAGKLAWLHSAFLMSKLASGAYEDVAGGGTIEGDLAITTDPMELISRHENMLLPLSAFGLLGYAKDYPSWMMPEGYTTGPREGDALDAYAGKALYLAFVGRSNTNPLVGGHPNNSLRLILDYDPVTL